MLSIPIFNIKAYDAKTTHPALTQEVIKLFESQYSQYQFTDEEEKILEQGSTNEDDPLYRCLFHFYDPIYEKGLYGNISAKDWAEATKIQAIFDLKYMALLANVSQDLFASETDFSFDRTVFEYVHGDKLRGLESLGHILHLIEDTAVPPHTRADAHPLGSPYEEYAKRWTKESIDIADDLVLQDEKIVIYDYLSDYFYNLALFSNQNFFSEDTIFTKRYSEPVIDYEKVEILSDGLEHKFSFNKIGSRLIEIQEVDNFSFLRGNQITEQVFIFNDIDNLIFTDYWNALSKQAVLYGAGVVKLFFDKVEEEKRTGVLYKKNQSWYKKIIRNIGYGINNIIDFILEVISRFRKTLVEINPQDMVADIGSGGDGGDFVAEVVGESQQLQPQNHPEDPDSPELKRLAMILKEAERMIARLEKGIDDLEKQAVGGINMDSGEIGVLLPDSSTFVVEIETEKKIVNSPVVNWGGGSASAPTSVSPVPILTTSSTTTTTATTTPTTTATTTPAITLTTTTPPILINPPVIISPDNFSQFATTTIDFSGTASSTQIISSDFSSATTTVNQDDTWVLTLADFEQGTTTINFYASDNQENISSSTLISVGVNTATTTTETSAIDTMPVVINEIAWKGTSSSLSTDEWIELYNRSDVDVDLNDWILYSEDLAPVLVFSDAGDQIIEAGSYYLIERSTDDNTISDIPADFAVAFSGWTTSTGLGNDGEHLVLAYKKPNQATTTVDEAPFGGGWPTQDGYLTLERRNPAQSGTDTNNWALVSNDPDSWNGLDANREAIKGTPKQENSNNAVIDTTAPDSPSLEILQCSNSMSASSCLIATTMLDILWATTTISDDFSHFNIDDNGTFSTSTATTTQVTNLTDGDTYTFSVATVDTNGNVSATTTKTVTINQMPVVINEIAWAGTDASAYDEWIELYNRSGEDIDLSDWMLYSQSDDSPNLSFSDADDKIIEAGSYYLIERSTDDNTISDISADCAFAFNEDDDSDGLSNRGEHLILAYKKSGQATTTVDEVPFESGWPAGGGYRTLEKYNPNLSGTDIDNWDLSIEYTASYDLLNGLDANGNLILGTPRARNSINYKIAKDDSLIENKTITKANSPYFVGADGLTIQTGKTLTIGEGVIIKTIKRYGDAKIVVNGEIQAEGTSLEPIIFTTFGDDEGGDTNGDGVCVSGTATSTCPGELNNFWSQIILTSVSENSNFNHTTFRYGGNRLRDTYPTAMVIMDGASANFTDSTFENSYTSGAYFESATSTISNCIFQNNKTQIAYTDYHSTFYNQYYGLVALRGEITVQNSNFNHNQVGLGLFDTVGAVIDSNVFNYNNSNEESFPLYLSGSAGFTLVNNSGANNDKNGISVWGVTAKEGVNTSLVENPLPYILEKGLTVSENSTLEIGPRAVFKFDGGGIGGSGQININGGDNEADRISFISISDSVVSQSGMGFSSSTPVIKNAEFRYLDRALSFTNCDLVDLNLENVLFENNTWSIYADNQNAQVTFVDNLVFATTTSMSMNAAVEIVLQEAKHGGANITW